MKGKEESEKGGLKLNIQKTKIMASSPITSHSLAEGPKRCLPEGHFEKGCKLSFIGRSKAVWMSQVLIKM